MVPKKNLSPKLVSRNRETVWLSTLWAYHNGRWNFLDSNLRLWYQTPFVCC